MIAPDVRCTLTGVGALASPRFLHAGLLLEYKSLAIIFDGGEYIPHVVRNAHAWLLTDMRGEHVSKVRQAARRWNVIPSQRRLTVEGVMITPMPVVHTNHPTCGYLIETPYRKIAWCPEYYAWPKWCRNLDLMFSEAAGWDRPIHFAGKVGGHMCVYDIAKKARQNQIKKLVYCHIGRPVLRAMDLGLHPPFGEFGREGGRY